MATTSTSPSATVLPTDQLAATIVSIISQITNNVEAPAIDSAAEAAEPFLAWPVIKQIFEAVIGDLTGKMAIVEEEGALQIVFNIQADSKLSALAQSALALQKANQTGDAGAISQATQNAINQWGAIIHFGGVAPVNS
jgi:hypothetical protein